MIQLREIFVRVQSEAGPFEGRLEFAGGLNVVSARNAFGKSLSVKTVPWCLGLEVIFGRPNNDASFFPLAALNHIDLPDGDTARVLSSESTITLERDDKVQLRLTRAIRGDRDIVRVEETDETGKTIATKLVARAQAMQDEHGGLQRFLFEWLGWPRVRVTTYKGTDADVYAENLAPLFYIEQEHGWGDLQATQIGRYAQQQINEIAVEYLLGATGAIQARFEKNREHARGAALRERARLLGERVTALFTKQGWAVEWTGNGSIRDIEARWSSRTLMTAIVEDTQVDLAKERVRFTADVERLRNELTNGKLDLSSVTAPSTASQRAIELKQRRHHLNVELRTIRAQLEQAREVVASLELRLKSSGDVLRLVTTGVGRLTEVECPTCHRHLEPADYQLAAQSDDAISAHIEALKRDLDLMRANVASLERAQIKVHAEAERVDSDFRDAERALQSVNEAVGPAREQLVDIANRLTAAEKNVDRVAHLAADVLALQEEVDSWLLQARKADEPGLAESDLPLRVAAFTRSLREYLVAWGHSAIDESNSGGVRIDERYEPYLRDLRLKALGSASDGARLIAAYTLAIAAASADPAVRGLHPGLVILDEPLQQNPDAEHRALFVAFLSKHLAQAARFQTIVFTSLQEQEVQALQAQNVRLVLPPGKHFLMPVSPARAEGGPTAIHELPPPSEASTTPSGT